MIEKLVGHSFNPTKAETLKVGSMVDLVHDKSNKYSSRTIAVMFDGLKLGHVGEKNNEQHEEIFKALPLRAEVCTLARLEPGEELGKFKTGEITHLEFKFPMPSDEQEGIQSWNEPKYRVRFDSVVHRYTHEGKELIGATTYIKKWIKEFDADRIAGVYANNLGVKKSEVLAMWKSGGSVASTWGTAIHKALEHYYTFRELGKIIQDKKELDYNKALPSHPLLRKIVLLFIEKFDSDKKIVTEALVTNMEAGICGLVDRLEILDEEKKICRVQDYKVNIGSEEENGDKYLGQFADLPRNKLSKYQLQLSVYARMLELSGWSVEGLDVYIYENGWKHYELQKLKLDF
jgi:hypothetical protein